MAQENKSVNVIKIGFLGCSNVGKTSICKSIMNLEFDELEMSTIGSEKYETKFSLKNGKAIKVVIWDSAGQERFLSAALKTYRYVHGIILVFSVADKNSLEYVNSLLKSIKDNFDNISTFLIGNNIDIEKEKWEVTSEEAKEFAQKNNLIYFETSAKTKYGINDAFSYIIEEVYRITDEKLNNKNIIIPKGYDGKTGCFGKKKNNKKK